jgi:hypothetical protein
LRDVVDHDPAQALKRDLDRIAWQVDPFVHAGRDPNAPDEPVQIHLSFVITRGYDERDYEACFVVRTQERQIFRRAHLDGNRT